MENLPGTAIDKVQVTDTRERGTEHNSIIKPIAQEVTLNLTLKKQYKKGAFGHASAGAGTLDRYRAGGFLNFIKGQQRYAVYAGAGNLAGGAQSHLPVEVFAGGPGIPGANSSAGFSANVAMGKKSTLDLSYALDNNRSSVSTTTQQTNILPDSTFLYDNISSTSTINKTHRLATQYVNTIDTLQQFTMAPSVDFSDNTTHSTSDARSSTTTGDAINTQRNTNVNRDKNLSVANRATYSRASHDRKTNLNINWDFRLRNNNGTLDNRSENKFYHSAAIPSDTLNQQSAIKSNGLSNNVSVNLSRELGKHFAAIFNYTFAQTTDDYDKDTYDYNAVTGVHDSLDSLYSVHSHNTNVTHLPSASIGFHAGKLTLELGAGMRFIQQANKNIWKDSSIRIAQRNFSPRITTAYQFARYMQWNTNYTVGAEAPTPDQLAPVQDNTNPLYIRTGNPYLRSAITHNISTEMRTWSSDYRWHGGVRGTALISGNQIVDDTYYDTLGRQISTYQNTNGNYQVSGGVDAGARIKLNQWVLNADVASEVGRSQNNGFINQQQNKTVTTTIGPMLNLGIQYKQLLTIQAIGQVNYNSTHYSLEGINDVQYNTKRLFFLGKLVPITRLIINSSAMYFYNSQLPAGFQKSRTLINAAVSYKLLKAEKLSVGFSVNDLLNKNVDVNRKVTPTSIQNTQVNALKRFAMINLNYRLNTFSSLKG